MIRLRTFSVLLMALLFGCNEKNSNILPDGDLKYLEKYHCWPYDVSVYSINEVKEKSNLNTYPLQSYFDDNPKYKTSTWAKYSQFDTTVWYGMDKTLRQCDDNTDLYNQIIKGTELYYSGSYRLIKGKQEEKKRYEEILFLDISNKRLHIFKDMNKVY